MVLAGDIADETLSEKLVKLAVNRFGRLDIALNNAGIVHEMAKLPQTPSEEARKVIDVDLMGVFYAMKHQLPVMERQFREGGRGGQIVNVASVAGIAGAPRLAVYAAAKHGVVGLMRTFAVELGQHNIRVNSVHPTNVNTPMFMNETAMKVFRPDLEHPGPDDMEVVARLMHTLPVPPNAFVVDEAFRQIYADQSIDFRKLAKYDITKRLAEVRTEVNKRLGADVVKDVLVDELNFVAKREVRS